MNNKLSMLWPYKHHDKTTWKYIDVILDREKMGKSTKVIKWILNKNFKYKHLDVNNK